MEIQFAKDYIIHDIWHDIIYKTKSVEQLRDFIENPDLICYGSFETNRGLELFEIGKTYYGDLIVYCKRCLHVATFMKLNNDCKIIES